MESPELIRKRKSSSSSTLDNLQTGSSLDSRKKYIFYFFLREIGEK